MKQFRHKKFQLNQSVKSIDPKIELEVLEDMLIRVEKDENYELATVIFEKIKAIKRAVI
jgi:hypothetical protein